MNFPLLDRARRRSEKRFVFRKAARWRDERSQLRDVGIFRDEVDAFHFCARRAMKKLAVAARAERAERLELAAISRDDESRNGTVRDGDGYVRHGAAFETQRNFRCAIDSVRRLAKRARVRDTRIRKPKREIDHIVERCETPKTRGLAVRAPTIDRGIRPRPSRENISNVADEFFALVEHQAMCRVMTKVIADGESDVRRARRIDDARRAFDIEREWFFHEHVEARVNRRDRLLDVQTIGRRDNDRVARACRDQLIEILERRHVRGDLQRASKRVDACGIPGANCRERCEPVPFDRKERGCVMLADITEADERDSHRPSIRDVRRTHVPDELRDARPLPLRLCECAKLRRDVVPVEQKSMKHEREIRVGDAPRAKKLRLRFGNKPRRDVDQLFRSGAPAIAERRFRALVKHRVRRAFFAERVEVRANPAEDLSRSCALACVPREYRGRRMRVLEIFQNRLRLRKREVAVRDRRHARGDGSRAKIGRFLIAPIEPHVMHFEVDVLFAECDETRKYVRADPKWIPRGESSSCIRAAARSALGTLVKSSMATLVTSARVSAGHPPRSVHHFACTAREALDGRPLVDVAGHVVRAERALATRMCARGRSMIDETADVSEPVIDVRVAHARVALPSVRIRPHLFAFASEHPLARETQPRVVGFTKFLRARPRLVVERHVAARLGAFVLVDAKSFVPFRFGFARAVAELFVAFASEELVRAWRVHPFQTFLFDVRTVLAVDEDHAFRTRAGRIRHGLLDARFAHRRRGDGRGGVLRDERLRGLCRCRPTSDARDHKKTETNEEVLRTAHCGRDS